MADGEASATGKSQDDGDESRSEKVNRELIELINELRVALVGVQVLFAFLLAVPFAQGFADVTNLQKALFFVVLCSTAIASALLVAPSAYHRINFRSKDKEQMLRTSNGLMIGGLVVRRRLDHRRGRADRRLHLRLDCDDGGLHGGRHRSVRRPVVRAAGAAAGSRADSGLTAKPARNGSIHRGARI